MINKLAVSYEETCKEDFSERHVKKQVKRMIRRRITVCVCGFMRKKPLSIRLLSN